MITITHPTASIKCKLYLKSKNGLFYRNREVEMYMKVLGYWIRANKEALIMHILYIFTDNICPNGPRQNKQDYLDQWRKAILLKS